MFAAAMLPLTVFQKVIGCIYLDSARPVSFHEEHLQLMAADARHLCGGN